MYFKTRISLTIIILLSFSIPNSYCQLIINTAMTPVQLVQNVLLGSGVTVSNITYQGGTNTRASFTNGSTTNIGLNNGIILSTGIVTQIANPQSYFMSTNLGLAGDPNLNTISGASHTYDACVLQFDFVPLSDTVKFRYVFGSEEYPQYVCSQYFDVFGFFITGPNPSGGNYSSYNIARIPGTNLPVGINSINNGSPGSSYNSSGCVSLAYHNYYVDNAALNGQTICFGGFTKPLTAWCHVTPCQTYHVKLAVGEVGNGLYDSGVFLEANSFSTNTFSVNTSYSNTVFGNNAVEGCSGGIFSFILSSPATAPYTITYTVGGTATNGVDYPTIPTSVTIPQGQDSAAVVISPLFDGVSEGNETVILTYTSACGTQSDTIFIKDNNPLTLTAIDSTNICPGISATLSVIPTGGIPPYSYIWDNGMGNADTIVVSPNTTTTYTITVTDYCAQSATHNIVVTVGSISATATFTNENCWHSNGSAAVTPIGNCSQGWTYIWNTTPQQTTATVTNLHAGIYTVTVACGACTATASVTINNLAGPMVAITNSTNTICSYANGNASAVASGNNPPFNYIWSNGEVGDSLLNVTAGVYNVSVTDASGCVATTTITITDTPGPSLTVSSQDEICYHANGSATVNATGGVGNYTYAWSNGPNTPNNTGLTQGSYSVTVSDSECSTSATVNVIEAPGPGAGFFEHPRIITLLDGPVSFIDNSTGNIVNWLWFFGDGSSGNGSSVQHQYDNINTYLVTLIVTDNNGCKDTTSDSLKVKECFTFYIPNAFTPNGDDVNPLFFPSGNNVDPDNFNMMIFDRWGKLMFSTNKWDVSGSHGEGWNGTLNNKRSLKYKVMDVYVYKILVKEIDGPLHEYIGSITLIP